MCPSKSYVCLTKNQIKGVKKGRHWLSVSVLQRCPLRESRRYTLLQSGKNSVLDLSKVTYSVYRHDKHSTRSDGHHRCEQTSFLLRLQPSLLHLVSKKLEELKKKSHDFNVQCTVIAIPNEINDIKNLKLCCNIQCILESLVQYLFPRWREQNKLNGILNTSLALFASASRRSMNFNDSKLA